MEPSCGVGNFFGMLPESMAESRLYGVELEQHHRAHRSGSLYPDAQITISRL